MVAVLSINLLVLPDPVATVQCLYFNIKSGEKSTRQIHLILILLLSIMVGGILVKLARQGN